MTAAMMMGGFILIPNISAYTQYNLGYPRADLWTLYLAGGIASFGATRVAGLLIDRFGATRVGAGGVLLLLVVLYTGFYRYVPGLPVMALFIAFMVAMGLRNVAHNTVTSQVPSRHERARFMSIQSSVQHLAAAGGAFIGARMLHEDLDKHLEGIPAVTVVAMALNALVPLLMGWVEGRVRAKKAASAPEPRPAAAG
jgi:predicted MFS family arabinose efflux permease